MDGAVRGRGAGLNPANRHDPIRLHVLGEHLDAELAEHGEPRQVRTHIIHDHPRTILNKVDSPDMPWMKWTLNPYRGCEHGCVYCYARPDHERLGYSCGLDFETQILVKHDAPTLLRKELASPKWVPEPIMMAGVTDCYQPLERELRVTRGCLEVMAEAKQPVSIVTKSRLITRDLDLLREMARHGAVHVAVSITTLDAGLAGKLEPRASSPAERLRAVRELADAGVPTMVMVAPIIPAITDREVPAILEAAAGAGATSAGYVLLRLPYQLKALFGDWLERHYPDRAGHVQSLLRQAHGGKLYDATPGHRRRGSGAMAEQIGALFKLAARRHGLDRRLPRHDASGFRRPMMCMSPAQLPLFPLSRDS